ncbi:MAG: glycoside hydrolase family 19 protein [Ferruginibacter sp.]
MITLDQLVQGSGAGMSNAKLFLDAVNLTLDQFEINTAIRQLCFLSQVGHESGGLFFTEELASGQAYEGRKGLGNVNPGDGVKYKGRGLIQITGRTNYQALSDFFKVDFINNPTLLAGKKSTLCDANQLKYAALSAGWFWNNKNLNSLADKMSVVELGHFENTNAVSNPNLDTYILITKKINGGTNGLQDRVTRFNNGVESKLFL